MTQSSASFARERVRHPLRIRELSVVGKRHVAPNMVRITFTGDDLDDFKAPGPADHVKVFFPNADGVLTVPTLTPDGIRRPESGEIISRDYTPFEYRSDVGELDIDFVLHGDGGPASAWASRAEVGSTLTVAGPRGSHLPPVGLDRVVLVADETGLPAAKRWLDAIDVHVPVTAVFVVEDQGVSAYFGQDSQFDGRSFVWVYGEDRYGKAEGVLRDLGVGEDTFVFLAGEASLIAPLRRYLRRELGLGKDQVDAHGYWKRGVAELDHHLPLDPSDPD